MKLLYLSLSKDILEVVGHLLPIELDPEGLPGSLRARVVQCGPAHVILQSDNRGHVHHRLKFRGHRVGLGGHGALNRGKCLGPRTKPQ